MKTILIIRHAKSSWADPGQDDFDRPLNDRGHRDAPAMAKRLHERGIKPDAFVTSPAKRALKTCRYFSEEFDARPKQIIELPVLYHAPHDVIMQVIGALDDNHKHVALFAHNPGVTDFVNVYTAARVDNVPTCGMVALQADTRHWSEFEQAEKVFLFFDYPKLHR